MAYAFTLLDRFSISSQTQWGSNQFGVSVAQTAEWAVVGAPWDDPDEDGTYWGGAYVYRRVSGVWSFFQKLMAASPVSYGTFGQVVDIDGTTIVVTASGEFDAGPGHGAVYVFDFNGTTWTQTQRITTAAPEDFGYPVAISGTWIAISDALADSSRGRVWLWRLDGGVWVEDQSVVAPIREVQGYFGIGMALDGSVLAVGNQGDQSPTPQPGAVDVFELSGGVWGHVQTMARSSIHGANGFPGALSNMPQTVAVSGNTVVASAIDEENDTPGVWSGAVYVFTKSGTWPATETIRIPVPPADDTVNANFGSSVTVDEDLILVGARGAGDIGIGWYGSAFLYSFSGLNATLEASFTPGVPAEFGSAVALHKGSLSAWVGAYSEDYPSEAEADLDYGTARVFSLSPQATLSGVSTEGGGQIIGDDGGHVLILTGTGFPLNEDLRVYLGPLGTVGDPPCYGGRGYGYAPHARSATEIRVISPPITKGTYTVTLRVESFDQTLTLPDAIVVLERYWPGKLFGTRACFPPWVGAGHRALSGEDRR